jgi:hypothetical protein
MFEHYTQRARRTIFFARYEASVFRSEYIDTEHLLLGILREDHHLRKELPSGAEDAIRKRIEELKPPGGPLASTSVDLPLSVDASSVLSLAAEESESFQHKMIDSGHLVLCLLRVENCLAATLLRENGIDYARYRDVVRTSASSDDPRGPQSVQRPLRLAIERPSAWHQLEALEPLAPSLKVHVRTLQDLVDSTLEHVHVYSEAYAKQSLKRRPWTRKEGFGHLIDCATTHQQWLARALTEPKLFAAAYPADEWVPAQQYDDFSWQDLVDLWVSLNRLLVHVLMRIPEDKLGMACRIGIAEPIPLSELIARYIEHCQDVVGQILARL